MSVRSGFFNSSNGDRKYDAEDIGNYFRGLITNGVLDSIDNRLQVTAGEGLTVNVDTGQAFVNCHWLINDAMLSLSLAAADVQYSRIDRVVLRLDTSDNVRTITIAVLKGTNSLNPTAPKLTRGINVHELCLADIYIRANAKSIDQTDITDRRADTALCGFVTGLIDQVDTSDLYAQYEAAFAQKASDFDSYMVAQRANFDDWYRNLTEELTVNVDLALGQYKRNINLTEPSNEVDIGIPEYETGDLLFVYVNGVLLPETMYYSITSDKKIVFVGALSKSDTITLICIKSVAQNFGDASAIVGKLTNVTAEVDDSSGTPSVEATLGGTEDAPSLHFSFHNLKGSGASASEPVVLYSGSGVVSGDISKYSVVIVKYRNSNLIYYVPILCTVQNDENDNYIRIRGMSANIQSSPEYFDLVYISIEKSTMRINTASVKSRDISTGTNYTGSYKEIIGIC